MLSVTLWVYAVCCPWKKNNKGLDKEGRIQHTDYRLLNTNQGYYNLLNIKSMLDFFFNFQATRCHTLWCLLKMDDDIRFGNVLDFWSLSEIYVLLFSYKKLLHWNHIYLLKHPSYFFILFCHFFWLYFAILLRKKNWTKQWKWFIYFLFYLLLLNQKIVHQICVV